MRHLLLLASTVAAAVLGPCFADNALGQASETMLNTTLYRVHVNQPVETPSEFATDAELRRLLDSWHKRDILDSMETLQLRSLVGLPGSAQVGRREPVVRGMQSRGGITTRSIGSEETGTTVGLTSREDGDKVTVSLEYESSFATIAKPAGEDDDRPEYERRSVATISVVATLLAKFGEATLVHYQREGAGGVYLYAHFDRSGARTARPPRVSERAAAPSESASSRTARAESQHEKYAQAMVKRYDANGDGRLSGAEMNRSGLLRSLRERQFPNLEDEDQLGISAVTKALLESGAFGRTGGARTGGTTGGARTGGARTGSGIGGARTGGARTGGGIGGARTGGAPAPRAEQVQRIAQFLAARLDLDRNGKISKSETERSVQVRQLRDRGLLKFDDEDSVSVNDVVKALVESGVLAGSFGGRSGGGAITGGFGGLGGSFGGARTNNPAARRPSGINDATAARNAAAAVMARFDKDKDGAISSEEAKGTLMERIMASDEKWDKNGDGKMDTLEYIESRRRRLAPRDSTGDDGDSSEASRADRYENYARSYFARFDANKDGVLDGEEKPEGSFHKLWDANKDDKVTLDEFIQGLRSRTPNRPTYEEAKRAGSEKKAEKNEAADDRSDAVDDSKAKSEEKRISDRYAKYAQGYIKKYDKDGDGQLNSDELVRAEFLEYDADKNGKLSAEEFAKGLQKR